MTEADLTALQNAGIIDAQKRAEIAAFLAARAAAPVRPDAAPAPRFDLTHVLWYAGALIIIAAMGIFTTTAFATMGSWALVVCGLAYGIGLTAMGHVLWERKNLRTPGGLLIAAAVSMVPMIIYGLQDALDLWKYAQGKPGSYKDFYPYINGSWIYMELGTIIAALLAIRRYRFPFILLIAAVALWFMSMDLAMWFTKTATDFWDFDTRRAVSLVFGLGMIAAAWAWDVVKTRQPDMMFWIHLFGALAFWGGLSLHDGGTALQKFIYCLINVGLVGFALFIDRRIYAVLGALGVAIYLGYLASEVFKDVLGFSFALSAIGLGIIFLGLWVNKRRAELTAAFNAAVPASLRRLRPADLPTT